MLADYDLQEKRAYSGVQAAEIAEHALDMEAEKNGQNRPGALERLAATTAEFLRSLRLYQGVKSAMRLFFKPIPPRGPSPGTDTPRRAEPRAKIIWQGYRPSAKDWANLDQYYECDVRGTSPTWIERRVKAARQKARAAMAPANAEHTPSAPAADRPEIIKQYKNPSDLLAIWPPIELPAIDIQVAPSCYDSTPDTVKTIEVHKPALEWTAPEQIGVPLFQNMAADIFNDQPEPLPEPIFNRKARRRAAKIALKSSRAPP